MDASADFERLYERLVLHGAQSRRKKKQKTTRAAAASSRNTPPPLLTLPVGPTLSVSDQAPPLTKRPKPSRPLSDAISSLNDTAASAELSSSTLAAVARLRVGRNLQNFSAACAMRSAGRLAGEIATSPLRAQQLLEVYVQLHRDRLRRLGPAKGRHTRRLGARMARVERIAARMFRRQRHDRDCSSGDDMRVLGDVWFFSPPAGQSMIAYGAEPNPVPPPPANDTSLEDC